LGTRVHAMVEEILRGRDPWKGFWLTEAGKEPEWVPVEGGTLEPYYTAYVPWHEQTIRQVILIEQVVWSEEHGYAGTLDNFVELRDNRLALLDVKSSRYQSWVWRLQTSAYAGAVTEQRRVPEVDVRGIVHLSSKQPGTLRFVEYWEHEREWGAWLSALDLHQLALAREDDWKR
jgi:hypothetical protein